MTTTPDDNERTVSKGLVPSSGRNRALDGPANALPAGTRLAEFEVLSVIGEGGFGIVYLAYDHSLSRQVAIKEYMPAELASRTQALTVSVRSERHAETFAAGLRSFINEARLLAQFDHPSLLKVYRFWEAHGTAYMVMPYYAGVTLGRTLKQRKSPPDEAWLRHLLEHLLNALEQMHEARCYHRDISPDNILIQPDGRPLLLDFGAARRVIGDMQRALTVILKTGYAPVEQYGEMPEMKQGAWTDLYALGSVMHYAIAGQTPPPAVQRFLSDKYVPLAQLAAARYSQGFLQAIDRSLAVQPQDRPQSAAEMRVLLALPELPARTTAPAPASAPLPQQGTSPAAPAKSTREPTLGNTSPPLTSRREPSFATSAFTTIGSAGATIAAPLDLSLATHAPATAQPAAPSRNDHRGRRTVALAGAAVAATVAASVGLVYLLVEFTASPPESSATVRYRTHDEDGAASTASVEAASAPVAQAQDQAGGLTAPASSGTPETLGASGTSTAPLDDPAPSDVATQAVATPAPAPVPTAEPPPVVARVTRSAVADRRPTAATTARASQSRRCVDIIQRVSLGEPLTAEEKDTLKQECGQ